MSKEVIVVGGSLSGMFAAVMLRDLDYSVTVLERRDKGKLLDQGAGLRLGEDVERFLDARGLTAYGLQCQGTTTFDITGKIVHEGPLTGTLTNWSTVHGVLKKYLEKSGEGNGRANFQYGCYVTKVEDAGKKVKVVYERDGREELMEADLVIGADGASSRVRSTFFPDLKRQYVGYVTYRGLCRPEDVPEATRKQLIHRAIWHFGPDNQAIIYTVPGSDDIQDDRPADERLFFNFAYYAFIDDKTLDELLTDTDGRRHQFSIPMGKVRPAMVEVIKETGRRELPPQMIEVTDNTEKPFVQVLTDVIAPQNCFFDGKVFLIGDASAGVRPHAAAATSQAIFHVTKLREMLEGKITPEVWNRLAHEYSSTIYTSNRELGDILMHQPLSIEGKINTFIPKFRGTHARLEKLYDELR